MSLLIDKLKLVTKATPQPMGFQTAKSASPQPKMLLIANWAPARNVSTLASYVTGADAVLFRPSRGTAGSRTSTRLTRSLSNIPWGRWLEYASQEEMKKTIDTGCDFVVFPASSTLALSNHGEKVGKILQVESSFNADLLRTVNELPVDAVLATIEGEAEPVLTWYHLMLFQRFAHLLTKPLLVWVPINITPAEVRTIWEAGVDGVVATAGTEKSAGLLQKLRQAIDDLNRLPPRKRGKFQVLLPRPQQERGSLEEVEEEEEED